MSERERMLITLIYLLQVEVECLRSVLSEWDHDKECYVQFNKSNNLRSAIEGLEHNV